MARGLDLAALTHSASICSTLSSPTRAEVGLKLLLPKGRLAPKKRHSKNMSRPPSVLANAIGVP